MLAIGDQDYDGALAIVQRTRVRIDTWPEVEAEEFFPRARAFRSRARGVRAGNFRKETAEPTGAVRALATRSGR